MAQQSEVGQGRATVNNAYRRVSPPPTHPPPLPACPLRARAVAPGAGSFRMAPSPPASRPPPPPPPRGRHPARAAHIQAALLVHDPRPEHERVHVVGDAAVRQARGVQARAQGLGLAGRFHMWDALLGWFAAPRRQVVLLVMGTAARCPPGGGEGRAGEGGGGLTAACARGGVGGGGASGGGNEGLGCMQQGPGPAAASAHIGVNPRTLRVRDEV